MRNIWEKIKDFFITLWNGLTRVGRILLGLILAALVVLVVYATSSDTSENKEENKTPEIAQVYEPSIGTPLPPDVPAESGSGEVGGAATTEPSTPGTTAFVAPDAGVDDDEPIKYDNSSLKFAAVLPAYSQVSEQSDGVKFTSAQGTLQYIVSVNDAGTETLEGIESQLRNSPTASNISYSTVGNLKALKFSAKGYGTGMAFIANGKIYYLLGSQQYFSDFKLL
jgi:hypothetical protein